ncbi:MAG: phage major capsid protein [Hyphomicrobiaceae bacterium]
MDNYETKGTGDLATAIDDLAHAFEDYKATNDQALAEIKSRGNGDVVTAEKLARLDRALDELSLKTRRPHLAATGSHRQHTDLAHKSAFDSYIRKGETNGLLEIEAKALSVASGQDGGYLVPAETETTVNAALKDISPIRAISTVRQVSGSVFKKPFSLTGPGTGWVGETASRPQTTTPTLAELSFPTVELYAMPAATPQLLDDAAVNIDEWIADEVRVAFAEQEGAAFVSGDGSNKPRGFLDYDQVADGSWVWGKIGFIATGVAGAFPASNPTDKLIDLAYSVKSAYRANAHFVMNRATEAAIRKFKDADGNYIWQPAARPGEAPTLLGHPVAESEDMPSIADEATAIAFGDFRRGYLIVDRVGIRVLRDPYSSKPYVLFYTTKRVGGGVQDFNAIKLLKFAD